VGVKQRPRRKPHSRDEKTEKVLVRELGGMFDCDIGELMFLLRRLYTLQELDQHSGEESLFRQGAQRNNIEGPQKKGQGKQAINHKNSSIKRRKK